MRRSRRRLLQGTGIALATGLAGCSGGTGDSDSDGGDQTFTVGHGDFQTEVTASDFPEKLFVYAVQTGWSNWESIMESFQQEYGVALNDDQRSSGEALSDLRTTHRTRPTRRTTAGTRSVCWRCRTT